MGGGGEGEGRGIMRGRKKIERVRQELIVELSGLQQRKQELLTQLSSLAPSTTVLEKLHHLKEISCDIDKEMSELLISYHSSDRVLFARELPPEAVAKSESGNGGGEQCV